MQPGRSNRHVVLPFTRWPDTHLQMFAYMLGRTIIRKVLLPPAGQTLVLQVKIHWPSQQVQKGLTCIRWASTGGLVWDPQGQTHKYKHGQEDGHSEHGSLVGYIPPIRALYGAVRYQCTWANPCGASMETEVKMDRAPLGWGRTSLNRHMICWCLRLGDGSDSSTSPLNPAKNVRSHNK